jgi:SNF2 family DNA or RNA helicase
MLVVKEHKKLLLNLNDPARIESIIPGAQRRVIKGHDIVSVPHDQDTVRVLRNMGINAPGPIRSYYDWPGRFPPFIHQFETAEFASLNPRAYILNDMGTGKTISALWAFDYLRSIGMLDWVLVVSPLSTLERTWADEIFKNLPDMSYGVVYGNAARRMKVARDNYVVYIINHDGIKDAAVLEVFATKPGRGLIIVDELGTFRNANTDRWKYLNALINGNKKRGWAPKEWAWGLTGTPIPNEPTDAWAQCKLITPGSVSTYFGAFRDSVMNKITQYKWAPKKDALDTVHRVMQPAIRFNRADCIDLPPTTFLDREVELSPEQQKLYTSMLTKFKAEFEGGQITAANEAVKVNKLLQIALGIAYGGEGEDIVIPAKPRLAELMDIMEQAHAKVIVFVPLTGALNAVAEHVRGSYTVSVVHGGVSKSQRDDIYHDFMQPNGVDVIVAQPGCMSHGLTLTAADMIIWFGPINSADTYQQANARIVRPGQKRNTMIVRMQGSEIERKMYARLERRENSQGVLLEMFE